MLWLRGVVLVLLASVTVHAAPLTVRLPIGDAFQLAGVFAGSGHEAAIRDAEQALSSAYHGALDNEISPAAEKVLSLVREAASSSQHCGGIATVFAQMTALAVQPQAASSTGQKAAREARAALAGGASACPNEKLVAMARVAVASAEAVALLRIGRIARAIRALRQTLRDVRSSGSGMQHAQAVLLISIGALQRHIHVLDAAKETHTRAVALANGNTHLVFAAKAHLQLDETALLLADKSQDGGGATHGGNYDDLEFWPAQQGGEEVRGLTLLQEQVDEGERNVVLGDDSEPETVVKTEAEIAAQCFKDEKYHQSVVDENMQDWFGDIRRPALALLRQQRKARAFLSLAQFISDVKAGTEVGTVENELNRDEKDLQKWMNSLLRVHYPYNVASSTAPVIRAIVQLLEGKDDTEAAGAAATSEKRLSVALRLALAQLAAIQLPLAADMQQARRVKSNVIDFLFKDSQKQAVELMSAAKAAANGLTQMPLLQASMTAQYGRLLLALGMRAEAKDEVKAALGMLDNNGGAARSPTTVVAAEATLGHITLLEARAKDKGNGGGWMEAEHHLKAANTAFRSLYVAFAATSHESTEERAVINDEELISFANIAQQVNYDRATIALHQADDADAAGDAKEATKQRRRAFLLLDQRANRGLVTMLGTPRLVGRLKSHKMRLAWLEVRAATAKRAVFAVFSAPDQRQSSSQTNAVHTFLIWKGELSYRKYERQAQKFMNHCAYFAFFGENVPTAHVLPPAGTELVLVTPEYSATTWEHFRTDPATRMQYEHSFGGQHVATATADPRILIQRNPMVALNARARDACLPLTTCL